LSTTHLKVPLPHKPHEDRRRLRCAHLLAGNWASRRAQKRRTALNQVENPLRPVTTILRMIAPPWAAKHRRKAKRRWKSLTPIPTMYHARQSRFKQKYAYSPTPCQIGSYRASL